MKPVYGPIDSWQFGRAIGVDLVSVGKYCTFDCVYCPVKGYTRQAHKRLWFVGGEALQAGLEYAQYEDADCVAFAGTGEPTLASNLGAAIDLAKSVLGLPVVVCTNSSLLPRDDVRQDLAKADTVVAKLDAPNGDLFRVINGPQPPHCFDEVIDGLRSFRAEYNGDLVLQVTIIDANKRAAAEIAAVARTLSPSKVQLNTPWLCSTNIDRLSEMEEVCGHFADLPVERWPHNRESAPSFPAIHWSDRTRANARVMLMPFTDDVD